MVRAMIIAVLGLVGGAYLIMVGLVDVTNGSYARATPTPITYDEFVASTPAPGTVVEISGALLFPNSINEEDGQGNWTAAYSGIARLSDAEVNDPNPGRRYSLERPGVLAIADPLDGAGEFDRLAQASTVRGVVVPVNYPIDNELRGLIAGPFPSLDLNTCPKLRIALHDTSTLGYAKLGGGVALVLMPLLNVVLTSRKK